MTPSNNAAAPTCTYRCQQGELSQQQEHRLREDRPTVPSPGPVHCQGKTKNERDTRRVEAAKPQPG